MLALVIMSCSFRRRRPVRGHHHPRSPGPRASRWSFLSCQRDPRGTRAALAGHIRCCRGRRMIRMAVLDPTTLRRSKGRAFPIKAQRTVAQASFLGWTRWRAEALLVV